MGDSISSAMSQSIETLTSQVQTTQTTQTRQTDQQPVRTDNTQKTSSNTEETSEQDSIDVTKEKVETAVESINHMLAGSNSQLVFKFHEGLNEYYAAVVDEFTNKVIQEIPAKKLLDVYAAMKQYAGLLLDKKA